MSTKKSKPNLNKGDYRPETSTKAKSKPIYNAADYRAGWESEMPAEKGKGGKKKGKIFHYSKRLAPGATRDPWGGSGRA